MLLRGVPRLLQLIQLLLLLLVVTGAVGRERASVSTSHCSRHGMTAASHAEMGMAMAGEAPAVEPSEVSDVARGAAALEAGAPGESCPHCPPSECATLMPCASAPSGQFALTALPAIPTLPGHTVRAVLVRERAVSMLPAPPTPPPQAVS